MKNKANSLYIHIPFCEHICDYCDFTKLQYFTFMADKYLAALEDELNSYRISEPLKTIYVGGGTPTVLNIEQLQRLLEIIDKYSNNCLEYTFEANPETLNEEKLVLLKQHGVNRLSIGVESTNDYILKSINRHHTFEDVIKATKLARKIGILNINFDLIIGLPNVTENMFINDLNNLLNLNPDHMSCYSLTVNPNTVFYLKNIKEKSGDEYRKLYDLAENILSKNGFDHYEVSNWCKKGKKSEHNLTYWRNQTYYGVGLGASGYIDNIRYTNTKNFDKYCSGEYIYEKETVSKTDLREYMIMLNLRTNEGLNLRKYYELFDEDLYASKREIIEENIKNNLMIYDKKQQILRCTYAGFMVLDSLILSLI